MFFGVSTPPGPSRTCQIALGPEGEPRCNKFTTSQKIIPNVASGVILVAFGLLGALLGATWEPQGRQKFKKWRTNLIIKSVLVPGRPKVCPRVSKTSKMESRGFQNGTQHFIKKTCLRELFLHNIVFPNPSYGMWNCFHKDKKWILVGFLSLVHSSAPFTCGIASIKWKSKLDSGWVP